MGKYKEVLLEAEHCLRRVGKLITTMPIAGCDGYVAELKYAQMNEHVFAFMVLYSYEKDDDTHSACFILCEGALREVTLSDYGLACYKALDLTAEVPAIMAQLAEEQA